MLTEEELKTAYQKEIAYQKHMIENVNRWFGLFFMITSIFAVLLYFFHHHLLVTIILTFLIIVGVIILLLLGYVMYNGQKNIKKVIADFEAKVKQLKQ